MLLVAVVVVVLLTGLPVLTGMGGMPACDHCGPGVITAAPCLAAILAAALVLPALLRSRVRSGVRSWPPDVFAFLLERPPQLV